MKEKILALWNRYADAILYLFFGLLTTAVNYVIYFSLNNYLGVPEWICELLAGVGSVAFAFLTNKPFVFKSHDWSRAVVIPELIKFISCRVPSVAMSSGIIFLAVNMLHGNDVLWKVLTSVLVVVLNYFGSKLLVFRKK